MTHCKLDLVMQLPWSECVRHFNGREISLEETPHLTSGIRYTRYATFIYQPLLCSRHHNLGHPGPFRAYHL